MSSHLPRRASDGSLFIVLLAVVVTVPAVVSAREIVAARTDDAPLVDGRLDDSCWVAAAPSGDFFELNSVGTPTQQTEVRVCFDAGNLYVAFECWEEDMDAISAAVSQRDDGDMFNFDDCVGFCLDTFHDERSCYIYAASVLGTKLDLHASECGRSVDGGWDAVWDVATARHADRWTAEFAVPFAGMRFGGGDDPVWGVDFVRSSTPHQEVCRWVHSEAEPTDASTFGDLVGLDAIKVAGAIEFLPYFLGRYDVAEERDYVLEPDGSDWTVHPDVGIDVEYSPTSTVTLNATLNPDFAQIEADPNRINLTGDELWLEERRPFFSENADIYDLPLTLLYTRRMEDIVVGAKGTGKAGGGSFAALYVRSDDLPRDVNGSALTDTLGEVLPPVATDYGALIYRKDIFDTATLGGFLATRERDDDHSWVGALMYAFSPMEDLRATAIAARTSNTGGLGEGGELIDEAFVLDWSFDRANFEVNGSVGRIGERFSPEIGFVPEDDRGRFGGHGDVYRRFETASAWLDAYSFSAWGGRYDDLDGELEQAWGGGEIRIETENRLGFEAEGRWGENAVDYPEHPAYTLWELDFETNVGGWHGYSGSLTFGEYHNSNYLAGSAGAFFQPVEPLTVAATARGVALREHADLDWLVNRVRVNYRFSREMFLRTIVQGVFFRAGDADVAGADGDRSHRYDLSMLYGWEFRPGSMLYVAYNHSLERLNGDKELLDPVLVLKVSYLMNL